MWRVGLRQLPVPLAYWCENRVLKWLDTWSYLETSLVAWFVHPSCCAVDTSKCSYGLDLCLSWENRERNAGVALGGGIDSICSGSVLSYWCDRIHNIYIYTYICIYIYIHIYIYPNPKTHSKCLPPWKLRLVKMKFLLGPGFFCKGEVLVSGRAYILCGKTSDVSDV